MTEPEVVSVMRSSVSEQDWDRNADLIKEKCGGYPDFWFSAIVRSGLMKTVIGDDTIKIKTCP